ncbi:TRAP transporter substrate-binding protein [Hyphomicrobium sp.]|uniref:TRAP transporter substrate-binding protein n=1 Tax=Hyphomicrobium sp. TaxID=82 RepID=UPI0025C0ECFC|nr:TRAP transporter substrate-binding protein [Hyphomicrobium sp.]MCC7252638.1 TRAP transporter substrate-binding protein DctP [Hyphomicrobium sp.]
MTGDKTKVKTGTKAGSRREFLKKAGAMTAGVAGATTIGAPYVKAQSTPIKWRLQTYAGAALGPHVTKPAVDHFNKIAKGEAEIELYYADQLVPTGELFRALQAGTIDAVHSDDDSMAAPVEVAIFGGYFPFATKHLMDVPVLFAQYGLGDIWRAEYKKAGGVVWLSACGQDACHFNTKKALNTLKDLDGLRLYTFPTAGRFLTQFGVVPVSIPYEDVQVAVQTGELDGMAWSGITEDYTVGWADVTDHFLTNNMSGAWIGSWFVNEKKWAELPPHLQQLWLASVDACHHYRNYWYWGGEAKLRATGDKLKLTSIPNEEWATVEAAALKFWDEVAAESEVKKKVIDVFREYNGLLKKAGGIYAAA